VFEWCMERTRYVYIDVIIIELCEIPLSGSYSLITSQRFLVTAPKFMLIHIA
jgi:hypothetical protein